METWDRKVIGTLQTSRFFGKYRLLWRSTFFKQNVPSVSQATYHLPGTRYQVSRTRYLLIEGVFCNNTYCCTCTHDIRKPTISHSDVGGVCAYHPCTRMCCGLFSSVGGVVRSNGNSCDFFFCGEKCQSASGIILFRSTRESENWCNWCWTCRVRS